MPVAERGLTRLLSFAAGWTGGVLDALVVAAGALAFAAGGSLAGVVVAVAGLSPFMVMMGDPAELKRLHKGNEVRQCVPWMYTWITRAVTGRA